jgi:ankyrin repeat protein
VNGKRVVKNVFVLTGTARKFRILDFNLDDFRMILDRGCSLDVADVDGDTVLHLAARKENNELLAALLRKGANPDIKNRVIGLLLLRYKTY